MPDKLGLSAKTDQSQGQEREERELRFFSTTLRISPKEKSEMNLTAFPILMYHRVEDGAYMHTAGLRLSGEHCSLERFRGHLERLTHEYRVLELTEVADAFAKECDFPPNTAVITFDDGTRDHIEVVFPLLCEFGLPATFFVMSGPFLARIPPTFKMQIITGGVVPLDEVAGHYFPDVLKRVAPAFAEQYCKGVEVPPDRYIGEAFEVVRQMKYLFNYLLPASLKDRVADELFRELFGDTEADFVRRMFLTPEDVKRLADAGMTIGCHSRSHYNLSTIKEWDDVVGEVVMSKAEIAQATGIAPEIFAYPAGGKQGYTPATVKLVALHYRAAVITGTQRDFCTTSDSIFELPRLHEEYFV